MQTATRYTAEDYLALDAASERRHEFLGGDVRAMAGAEPEHNVLKGNIARELGNRLLRRGCRVMTSDQRVRLGEGYVYPDVVVACAPEYVEPRPRSLVNPDLVVEVTSASTAKADRAEKLVAYTAMESLREYWIAETDRALITQYVRQEAGWFLQAYASLDATLISPHFDLEIPMEALYALVLPG